MLRGGGGKNLLGLIWLKGFVDLDGRILDLLNRPKSLV